MPMQNRTLISEEDLNRIEVLSSEFVSTETRNIDITDQSKNTSSIHDENIGKTENLRRQPMQRWSVSLSRSNQDEQSKHKDSVFRRLWDRKSVPLNLEVEKLVNEIEQHESLVQSNPFSQRRRMKILRSLPQPILMKRLVKQRLLLSIKEKQLKEHPTFCKKVKNCWLKLIFTAFLKAKNLLNFIINAATFWNQDLRNIEAQFGSNVYSYFKFLSYLFSCNLISFILPLSFITIPQMLFNDDVRRRNHNFSTDVSFLKYSTIFEIFELPGDHAWNAMDFLTGEGMMKTSLMFYGSYSNVTFSYRDSRSSYNISTAYFVTIWMLYLSAFFVISSSVARTYRRSYIKSSKEQRNLYVTKVLLAWSYNISDEKEAQVKHFSVYTELKKILYELRGSRVKPSFCTRIWIYFVQTIAHVMVCAIIAAASLIVWILLNKCDKRGTNHCDALYFVSLVNLTIHILQMLFSWISTMEDYRSPSSALHVSLVRNFLLESTVIFVLLCYWTTKKHVECWETVMAQEIYRLIISDSFIRLLICPLIICIRVFILGRVYPKFDRPDFDISLQSSGLIYNQTLLWIGLFYAPLLAGIMSIKIMLLFHINRVTMLYLCKPPRYYWRSQQTSTIYLLFSFLSLIAVIIALGYMMTHMPVSQDSGPFRDHSFVFHIFIDRVLCLRKCSIVWSIFMFVMRRAIVFGILTVISILVYTFRAKAQSHRDMD